MCDRGYSLSKNSFVRAYDSDALDASLLQLPLVGFLPIDDPRVTSTVAAVERELLIDGTFVLRYRTEVSHDGLPPGEGAFLACSFWLVSVYAMQGRQAEAQQLFERLLRLGNDVGLFAEEYDVAARRLVGNFPQAFSHAHVYLLRSIRTQLVAAVLCLLGCAPAARTISINTTSHVVARLYRAY